MPLPFSKAQIAREIIMAILKSKDGKELLVDCSCGCNEGLRLSLRGDEDSYMYLSLVSGNFYRDQKSGAFHSIGRKLKKIWRIIRGKDYIYSEICLTKSELDELREYLDEAAGE